MNRAPALLDATLGDIAGIVWPPPALGARAQLLATALQLERSQWFDPQALETGQHLQLVSLASHAARHSPLFARRLAEAGLDPRDLMTPEGLRALPLLKRADLQQPAANVDCAQLPPGHGPLRTASSSGSTGEPVTVRKTPVEARMWSAQTLRWFIWSGGNPSGRLAVARANVKGPQTVRANWGSPIAPLFRTGPALVIDVRDGYDALAKTLAAFDPHSLMLYPSHLAALVDRIDAGELELPSLGDVRLLAETLPEGLRQRCAGRWRLSNCYSTAELGYLAIECPVSGLLHVTSESAIVEVLRDDGTPAQPGESGRVVATALHNFATPLIRYEVGDWAEVAAPCRCGRGLPSLARIHGRTRNRMVMPDGTTRWALTGTIRFSELPIAQAQLVQHAIDRLELRYTGAAPLSPEQAAEVRAILHDTTHPAFTIDLSYVAGRLDNPKSGKFEEFVSRL